MRIERDSIGTLEIPSQAYYGIHSQRAAQNFAVTTQKVHPLLLKKLILIKMAAAEANYAAGQLTEKKYQAITQAGQEISQNFAHYQTAFITPAIQGGAGTSTNMNVNEVIANRALELLGHKKGEYKFLHPNDDVNRSQSTNDTYPTAAKLALLELINQLNQQLDRLIQEFQRLAAAHQQTIKLGRTQLQDAVPTTFGASFTAYASLLQRCSKRLTTASTELLSIPLGGTAIGTGINTTPKYQENIVADLAKLTQLPLRQATDLQDAVQNTDSFLAVADACKNLAAALGKIANDLRLLGSGPQAGLGELELPKTQAGSSIMPGKVNPVIPEVVNQIVFQVIGYATTVTMAVEAGQLELNAFEPVMFKDLFDAAELLTKGITTLISHCLQDLKVNQVRCRSLVENSAEIATVLAPKIGYAAATAIVKTALKERVNIRTLLKQQGFAAAEIDQLLSSQNLLNQTKKTMQADALSTTTV
ncbi:MAG: aspartate ammonia-lyase [Liquorilactobacillus ghanensis]|uniref:aspartate ammonia-lyase n=1 Tax=Liquorilactobacillus ghanensis TaxID=399370 RepID=UPI0039E7AEB6